MSVYIFQLDTNEERERERTSAMDHQQDKQAIGKC
jgi:hypothetical protein